MVRPAATAIDLVHQATVQIRATGRMGTGFFVAPNVVATCAHVVPPQGRAVEIVIGDRTVPATVRVRLPNAEHRGDYRTRIWRS
jgi:hypothetical protein